MNEGSRDKCGVQELKLIVLILSYFPYFVNMVFCLLGKCLLNYKEIKHGKSSPYRTRLTRPFLGQQVIKQDDLPTRSDSLIPQEQPVSISQKTVT